MTTREMNASALTRHIDAVAHTARAVEDLGRKVGYYARDCNILDAALKAGKSGFVVLLNDSGEVAEVHPIGRDNSKVAIERGKGPDEWSLTYHPEWKRAAPTPMKTKREEDEAARRGNASTVDPYEEPERKEKLMGDALRAKQIADSKRERDIRAEGIARSEKIFAAAKAESDRLWNRSA